jgi:centromeric protein E
MTYSPTVGGDYISAGEGGKQHDSLLSLPSPPQSRASSANDQYSADLGDEAGDESTARGRPRSIDAAAKKELDAKNDKGNVLVSVRVRPESGGDGEASNASDGEWLVDGRRSLISFKGKEAGDYRYDNVFSPHDNNARVYDNAAKRLVRRVMEGYHGTVFAYGMTGTGKTFSMQGTSSSPGVIPLAITDIFSYIRENPNREFLLRVSYLEIYNEKIYDLLSQSTPGQQQQEEIKLREDSKRGVYATPLKEEIVQSPNQLLRVIARGDTARRVGSTQFNARSSRSHAVVSIVVESRERTPANNGDMSNPRRADRILPGGVLVSTLSLIDLAGSEKAAENKERRAEGAHINKSLLTLGTVIGRLSNEDEKDAKDGAKPADKDKAVKHLPYRDSKLTRLLQPALSGDSLVSILCTVQLSSAGTSAAHASSHTGETLNTLKFASRAKNNIVSHAKKNESNNNPGDPGSRALLDRYRLEIQELRTQLEKQNKSKEATEEKDEVEEDRKREEELEKEEHIRHEEQMLEMQLARTALKERISHLNRLILSSKSIGVNSGRFSSSSVGLNTRMSSYSLATDYGRPVSVGDTLVDSKRNSSATNDGTSGDGTDSQSRDRVVSATSTTFGEIPPATVDRMEIDDTTQLGEDEAELVAEGEGQASLGQQVRMLQSDLSDKNRYIATLEKRLLQARRTSHSRVSMQFAARVGLPEESSLESLLRERDREIDELRAKLDDQMRMVTALRSAARKRDMIENRRSHVTDNSENTERPRTTGTIHDTDSTASTPADDSVPDLSSQAWRRHNSSRLSNRTSSQSLRLRNSTGGGAKHRSTASSASRSSTGGAVVNFSSPMAILASPVAVTFPEDVMDDKPAGPNGHSTKPRRKSVDEMTMLLDQMIQDKVESGHVVRGDRGSLRIRHDTVLHGHSSTTAGNNSADQYDGTAADDYDHPAGPRFDTSPLNSPPLSSSANTSAFLLSPPPSRAPNGTIAEEDEESPIIPSHSTFGRPGSQPTTIGTITVTPTVPHTAPLPPVVSGLGLSSATWH